MHGCTLVTFHTQIIKNQLELIRSLDAHSEYLRTNVQHYIEKHGKLLLQLLGHVFVRAISDCLYLPENLELVSSGARRSQYQEGVFKQCRRIGLKKLSGLGDGCNDLLHLTVLHLKNRIHIYYASDKLKIILAVFN